MKTRSFKLFKKDLKRLSRRNVDFSLLNRVIELLLASVILDQIYKNHPLEGQYRSYMECHITPDWLLIYRIDGNVLFLERTGTHSDLF